MEFQTIIYYNRGYAFYKRAQQSWISETITNKNGLTFGNYQKTIDSVTWILPFIKDKRRKLAINLMLSNVYCGLYEFEKAKEYYASYIEENDDYSINRQKYNEIEEQADLWNTSGKKRYLEILDIFRKCVYEENKSAVGDENKHNDNDDVIDVPDAVKKVIQIAENKDGDKLFKENKMLCGKYYFVLSEYYSKQKKELKKRNNIESKQMKKYCENETKWAVEANKASSLYGLRLLDISEPNISREKNQKKKKKNDDKLSVLERKEQKKKKKNY
eukprot:342413_1